MLAEIAPIYRALAQPRYEHLGNGVLIETRRAFTPTEVDGLELWVIAELLGLNDAQPAGGSMTEAEFRQQAMALNEERIKRAREGLPPPPAPASATPEVTPDMIAALRARREAREAAAQGA